MHQKIPTILAIGIILIFAVAVGAGVWWYGERSNKVIQPNQFYKNIEETCKNSGGTYIGGPPSGWMDNREMWMPCNCSEGMRWSFSPNFRCEPERKQKDSVLDIDIFSWQTYRNDSFEFKYPEDWNLEKNELAGRCPGCADLYRFSQSSIEITIGGSMIWETAKNQLEEGIDGKSEQINIAGLNGISREGIATDFLGRPDFKGKKVKEIIFRDKNNMLYYFFTEDKDKNIFNQILSTFRFIE